MNEPNTWDAIVIGAGPAGALAACLLARQDYSVLLLDKAPFPRYKVCGCCLNRLSLQLLKKHGLVDILDNLNAIPLHSFWLRTHNNSLRLNLPESAAISREAFDQAITTCAVKAGAEFRGNAFAYVGEIEGAARLVTIKNEEDEDERLRCRVVIVADGISGRSLDRLPEFLQYIHASSRIGAGTVLPSDPACYQAGTIYMSAGTGGYVGVVRLEDGRLDLAGAFDLRFVRKAGGPAAAAAKILHEVGFMEPSELQSSVWQGTSALTRYRKKKAGERLFIIGDAASYPEPLTGEGISWALLSATSVAPIASQAISGWTDQLISEWTEMHASLIGRRQSTSALLARLLRSASLTALGLEALEKMPVFADFLLRYLNLESIRREAEASVKTLYSGEEF